MLSKIKSFIAYLIFAILVIYVVGLYQEPASNGKPFPKSLNAPVTYSPDSITQLPEQAEYAIFPVVGHGVDDIISGWYDRRGNRLHQAVDIKAPRGTLAIAITSGTITRVTEHELAGKYVVLHDEANNLFLYYAHLDEQLVEVGNILKQGDVIGRIGDTGNATTPHLHFAIKQEDGTALDPIHFFQ